ncbi:hypothetical protein FOZ61_009317 [Perkinsus olseni]|uniref:alanine--glyoxylate transaminase n=1 Tax=Perkinsus olseni TaxID=32597 RepID=A0A2K8DRC1_PEROL|nr:Alanine-glyoxylate aminotransferase [Perkinsus olseni]KAF4666740.1 hypothetical protein FOZ61_009317 [Perkinsus olseni]KAF4673200.1 hypothetical protein FOL46_007693 [Perkinsus olseni]
MLVDNPFSSGEVKPFKGPTRLLLGPGPQNAHPEVHAAMSLPQVGHMDAEFLAIVEDLKKLLRYVWQTKNTFTIPVSGTGSAAWEAAIANLTEVGDTHLIFVNGYFGERALDMHSRYGANVQHIRKPYGTVFTLDEIRAGLEEHKPKLMWICHAETSTGTKQPMDGIGNLCREHDCLLLLDTVTSICGAPVYLDEWKVDAAYAGTQKCMGCPPGVAPLTLGDRALAKLASRKSPVPNWYLDMTMIRKYIQSSEGAPRVYHHTAPISMIYAMRAALQLVAEEGLEKAWARHQANADYLVAELKKLGLEVMVKDEDIRLPSLTAVMIPQGVDGRAVVVYMREKFNIEIGLALGELAGKVWRIGLMGYNSRREIAKACVAALAEALQAQDFPNGKL